jgi:hypothetical protein
MNLRISLRGRVLLAASPMLFGAALLTSAASAKTNSSPSKPNQSAVATNVAPVAIEIPRAVFTVPATAQQGKDPFFPRSRRPFVSAVVVSPTNPPPVVADLRINGTSGSEEQPLVIINNVTFGVGDIREVTSGGRRISVHCLEINLSAGSATVEADGLRRVLRFQKMDK